MAEIKPIAESDVERAAIQWFREQGYEYLHGSQLEPDSGERSDRRDVMLAQRLRASLQRINPQHEPSTLDDVARRLRSLDKPNVAESNLDFHLLLTRGVQVDVKRQGQIRGDIVRLVDWENADNNDWLVVNQLRVSGIENHIPDLIVYLNGLPVGLFEFKSATRAAATIKKAYNQLRVYRQNIPQLFVANELLVVSTGSEARYGSLTAGWERFARWRTIDGTELAPDSALQLEVLIRGMFDRPRLLDYLRHFILFETGDDIIKKIAGYHQFHAVNKAVERTIEVSKPDGNRRIGVVWHTQGSGKSIAMAFFGGKMTRHPEMKNPTLVVITDRNDLDDQLFGQFAAAQGLMENPVQAEGRSDLRKLLTVSSGGVVFTTMQKFTTEEGEKTFPQLSDRHNIVVMADEAHRSQYGFAGGMAHNLRKALPNAAFIGFTGTPIEFDDRSTPEVFGDYIDIYPVSQAVDDGATVPIHYEGRLARIELPESQRASLDEEFDELTEDEDEATADKLRKKWSQLEAVVGSKKRLKLVARDIVEHFRRRQEIVQGKAMIVCMSRAIAAALYKEIVRIKPDWDSRGDGRGKLHVVMTGSPEDPPELQKHLTTKEEREALGRRFKDPDDPFEVAIVCDMWLTGFDVPCAHTLYLDKPLKGHTLMQAIARVNRVYKDKPNGLVVDYLGVAQELRKAITWYDRGKEQSENPGIPINIALQELVKRHEVVKAMFHGHDNSKYFSGRSSDRVDALNSGANHILGLDDGKRRYREAMSTLNKAAGIAIHLEQARHLRDDVAWFQDVQKFIARRTNPVGEADASLNAAIRQIVASAVTPDGVFDILDAAGIDRPDISVLDEQFLQSVQKSPHRNLQIETLKKLLRDEIKALGKRNVVQEKRFSEMLEGAITKYTSRAIDAAQVIIELVNMAHEIIAEKGRGNELGLSDDELVFYDALAAHGEALRVMGDQKLAEIASELAETIRNSASIDWTRKESVRADMRRRIKRLLRKHGYPPDQSEAAVKTVILQAERVMPDWSVSQTEPEDLEDRQKPSVPAEKPTVASEAWQEAIDLASESVQELLTALRAMALMPPEIGHDVVDEAGRVVGAVEVAWPEIQVGIILSGDLSDIDEDQIRSLGWNLVLPNHPVDSLERLLRK